MKPIPGDDLKVMTITDTGKIRTYIVRVDKDAYFPVVQKEFNNLLSEAEMRSPVWTIDKTEDKYIYYKVIVENQRVTREQKASTPVPVKKDTSMNLFETAKDLKWLAVAVAVIVAIIYFKKRS